MYILTFLFNIVLKVLATTISGHFHIYIWKENMKCIYSWLQWKANISKYQILTYMYTVRKREIKNKRPYSEVLFI